MSTLFVVPEEDREELRLALVLNGGISLAIWIGGVATEIERLTKGVGAYGELLALTGTTARVDVMAGASAGGINGAFLALAQAREGTDLSRLRDVWLGDGDFDLLLRDPLDPDPPSLLRGDEYFLPRLKDVFTGMARGNATDASANPVHLIITTTLMKGQPIEHADSFGGTIDEVTHRGRFEFIRSATKDDFDTANIGEKLALASRSTASFPLAFEPSYVPIGPDGASHLRPDMSGIASWDSSRYVLDGGALVNKPMRPLLRAIFAQPAERQVRRVLAYVIPDPGAVPDRLPVPIDDAPPLARVLTSAVLLPREESVAEDLDDLDAHNARVRARRNVRDRLLARLASSAETQQQVHDTAFGLVNAFRESRIDAATQMMAEQRAAPPAELEPQPSLTAAPADLEVEWLDPGTVETIASTALQMLHLALRLAPPNEVRPDLRSTLRTARGEVHRVLASLRVIVATEGVSLRSVPAPQLDRFVTEWNHSILRDLSGLVQAVMEQVVAVGEQLTAVVDDALTWHPDAARLEAMVQGFGADGGDPAEVRRRLLSLSILQLSGAAEYDVDQTVELLQLSGNAPNGFDGRSTVEEKLTGARLGHFGAFLKRSWRASDWMWGRIDATDGLVRATLSPERLRSLARAQGRTAQDVLAAIEQIAVGDNPAAQAVLRPYWNAADVELELSFIDDTTQRPPPYLEVSSRAIARRLQFDAIVAELPVVAASVMADHHVRAHESYVTLAWAHAVLNDTNDGKAPLEPAKALRYFAECRIGEESIRAEVGHDMLTGLATKALAVGSGVLGAVVSRPKLLRDALRSFRGFALLLYAMARSAVKGSATGTFVLMALLATGGAILGWSVPRETSLPAPLTTIGSALVVAGVALAVARAGAIRVLLLVLTTLAAAIAPYVYLRYHVGGGDLQGWRRTLHDLAPATPIVAPIVGSMALGVLRRRPRRRARRLARGPS